MKKRKNEKEITENESNYCRRCWNEFTTLSDDERRALRTFRILNGLRLQPFEGFEYD